MFKPNRFFIIVTVIFLTQNLLAKNADLSIGIIQEWSTFNPVNSQLASNEALFPFIIRKMTRREANGKVVMDVAESNSGLSKKNNNFVSTWKIKNKALWGDGTAITCADWHLGWQAGLNPNVSVDARSGYEKIKNITWSETNPKTCEVTYSKNDWTFDRDLPPLLPAHLEKSILQKHGSQPEAYDRNSNYISSPTHKGLYNGPYYVSEFKLGSHLILTRNENFYGTPPKINKVIVKLITDTGALKANLLAGQINAISAVGFPPDTALLLDEEFKKTNANFMVRFQNSGIFQGVYFNLDREIFKDVKVREALSRAIDKSALVKAFFNDQLPVADTILSPLHPAAGKTESLYSVSKANKILDEAGWKLNSKNIREKNGKTLEFTFKTSAGLKVLENIQLVVCEKFKAVGARCNIKNEPPRALLGQSVPRGEFDLAMYGQPLPIDTTITSYFSSQEIPTAQNSWAGGNQIRLRSTEIDQLLKSFDNESNYSKRNIIIKKIEQSFLNNFYSIPLYHRREAVVVPKNLFGIKDSFEGTAFSTPEDWYFK